MIDDSRDEQGATVSPSVVCLLDQAMEATRESVGEQAVSTRGRPARLTEVHLAWALIWCVLMGSTVQLAIWRTIQMGFARFAPLRLTNQAIYKRLSQRGLHALHRLLPQVSGWLAHSVNPLPEPLAPFASDVLALDESTLDQVGRWLSDLGDLPQGDCRSAQWPL